jgi:hypothetical protein
MSTAMEWLDVRHVDVEFLASGEDWVGAEDQTRHVLALSCDTVVAIEGTRGQLHALAQRIFTATMPRP